MEDFTQSAQTPNPHGGGLVWEISTRKQFDQLLEKIPLVLRSIAEKKISQNIDRILKEDHRSVVNEKDIVDAFFAETPFGFHGPMKSDMTTIGLDYTQYGYPK